MQRMFLDIHAHLHVREFDSDRDDVIARAKSAGVSKMINVGFDVEGNFQALTLAKKHENIYASFGVHPHLASDFNDDVGKKIYDTAKKEEKIVALGEMGLDYFKNFQPKEVQKQALEAQLRLANQLDLPVIIHCRDAFADFFEIVDRTKNQKVLLHCFTGSKAEAEEAWKRGFYTSFTGIITYPKAEDLRKVVLNAPLERIFLETDCPYLAPQNHRGKRNEPAFVADIYKEVSGIHTIPIEKLASQIDDNAHELFGI